MEHIPYTPYTRSTSKETHSKEEWITATDFANEYHVGRSTAYEAFKRLNTIRIGGCLRARRSEIEDRLERYGRI